MVFCVSFVFWGWVFWLGFAFFLGCFFSFFLCFFWCGLFFSSFGMAMSCLQYIFPSSPSVVRETFLRKRHSTFPGVHRNFLSGAHDPRSIPRDADCVLWDAPHGTGKHATSASLVLFPQTQLLKRKPHLPMKPPSDNE